VLASDGKVNLSGRQKLFALQSRFKQSGFDYAGNASIDLEIWKHANEAIVVNGRDKLLAQARSIASVNRVSGNKKSWSRSLVPRFLNVFGGYNFLLSPNYFDL
jgi:hypothetical protein